MNNFFTLNDIYQIGTTFGKDFGALYMNYLCPVTNFGTRLAASFSHPMA